MIRRLSTQIFKHNGVQTTVLSVVFFLGMAFRFHSYLFNRSLWLDEAMLANNIIQHSLFDLITKPMDMSQFAPIGFLSIIKILVILLDESERVLRLLPIIAGVLMLTVVIWVARLIFSEFSSQLAFVGLVAFSPILIYYSVELKQYIVDACLGVLMLGIGIKLSQKYAQPEFRDFDSGKYLCVFALTGILGIWFSHSFVFFCLE